MLLVFSHKARGMTKPEKTKEEKIIIQSRAGKTMRWWTQHGPNQRRKLQTKQNKDKQNTNTNKQRGMTKQEKTKEDKIIIQSRADKTMRWSKQHDTLKST